MALRGSIQKLIQQGIRTFGDLAEPVHYTATTSSTYDPQTGSATRVVGTWDFPAVASKFESKDVDATVDTKTDMKLIVAYLDLPVEPTQDDICVVLGKTWTVQKNMGVPGSSVWVIHVRAN